MLNNVSIQNLYLKDHRVLFVKLITIIYQQGLSTFRWTFSLEKMSTHTSSSLPFCSDTLKSLSGTDISWEWISHMQVKLLYCCYVRIVDNFSIISFSFDIDSVFGLTVYVKFDVKVLNNWGGVKNKYFTQLFIQLFVITILNIIMILIG